jgi:hypothetical protein
MCSLTLSNYVWPRVNQVGWENAASDEKENTGIKVSVVRYDNMGTEPYNLTLSRTEQKAVVDYLICGMAS